MASLSLDPVEVDTDLAKKYLKKYNNFTVWPSSGRFYHAKKYPDNLIKYVIGEDNAKNLKDHTMADTPTAYMARKLAKKIEEFEPTFYQLEYFIRKTDKDDVKKNINLITQHLQCCDYTWNPAFDIKLNILVNEKTPLYTLGYVASAIRHMSITVNIITTQKMAPICHLFTEICAQIGWTIPLILVHAIDEYPDVNKNDNNEDDELNDHGDDINNLKYLNVVVEDSACGCTGVVTESADIDSALDCFINSSVTAPWRLQKLFVQDSVYDEVKSALADKCTRTPVSSCAAAFEAKGKIFACDDLSENAGSEGKARVPVESYRTSKELLALLTQQSTPSLSLWVADTQVAQEMALRAPSPLVWINEYATFNGPPAASIPVYERTHPRVPYAVNEGSLKKLQYLSKAWEKLSTNERIDLITNALHNLFVDAADEAKSSYFKQIQNVMLNWQNDSFASVDASRNRICYSVELPPEAGSISVIGENNESVVVDSLTHAISGRAVLYSCVFDDEMDIKILESLEKAGVPVMKCKVTGPTENISINLINKKLKVVSTNIVTIFAN